MNLKKTDMQSADNAPLYKLIEAALIIVNRNRHNLAASAEKTVQLENFDGANIEIHFDGPDIPSRAPRELANEEILRQTGEWKGTYALRILAPLVVLDVCWNENEPVMIHSYSRGNWKEDLLSFAEAQAD